MKRRDEGGSFCSARWPANDLLDGGGEGEGQGAQLLNLSLLKNDSQR